MGDLSSYLSGENNLQGMQSTGEQPTESDIFNRLEDINEALAAYHQQTEFTWSFKGKIISATPIERVASRTHEILVNLISETECTLTMKDPSSHMMFDTDFKLLFRNSLINQPIALTQKICNSQTTLMVSFLADMSGEIENGGSPGIDVDSTINYDKIQESELRAGEFTFIVDRSYSMNGDPIDTSKEALKLFIHSLPPGSKFNIISFGSMF